jgi:uncharacterized protein YkwD
MKPAFVLSVCLALAVCNSASAQTSASPAQMISNYRLQHGEGRVTLDRNLTRIAQEQATAMASKDTLDHSVVAPFHARVSSSGSERAAENIAYGHDSFAKTLNQWIESSGHRQNLLMHNASRVGIASAKSSRTSRTYWAMVIAGGQKPQKLQAAKQLGAAKQRDAAQRTAKRRTKPQTCRIAIFSLCL